MSVPMIVVDSDSLLVERKEGADCAIFLPAPPAPENASPEPSDAVPEDAADTGEESTPEESLPYILAMSAFNGSGSLAPRQVIDWLIYNDITDVNTDLMVDVCDELMISDMTAVCLMSDNSGFVIHHVKKTSSGDWDCQTFKGDATKYAVITSDGVVHLNNRSIEAESPELHAVDAYATYARHNDELSNDFDHFVVEIDEIILKATIVKG